MSLAMTSRPAALPPFDWRRGTVATAAGDTPGQKLLQAAFAPARLDPATVRALLCAVQAHSQGPGPLSLTSHEQAPSWWLLATGRVVVGKPGPDGALVESRVLQPGQWLDVASAWTGGGWIESAQCTGAATLWALPLDTLMALCREDAALLHAMGSVMAQQLQRLTEGRHELATKDVTARVASWLLRQLPAQAQSSCEIRLCEEKQSIARQLAMAKETMSRCLRRLVERGCIAVDGYRVTVLDLRDLKTVAGVALR